MNGMNVTQFFELETLIRKVMGTNALTLLRGKKLIQAEIHALGHGIGKSSRPNKKIPKV